MQKRQDMKSGVILVLESVMKRQESFDITYKIIYDDEVIHENLNLEECIDILQDFSERYFLGENINPTKLLMEKQDG